MDNKKKMLGLFTLGALGGFFTLNRNPQKNSNDIQELLMAIKNLSDGNTDKKSSIIYKNPSIEKFGTFLTQAYGDNGKKSLIERMKQSEDVVNKFQKTTLETTEQNKQAIEKLTKKKWDSTTHTKTTKQL